MRVERHPPSSLLDTDELRSGRPRPETRPGVPGRAAPRSGRTAHARLRSRTPGASGSPSPAPEPLQGTKHGVHPPGLRLRHRRRIAPALRGYRIGQPGKDLAHAGGLLLARAKVVVRGGGGAHEVIEELRQQCRPNGRDGTGLGLLLDATEEQGGHGRAHRGDGIGPFACGILGLRPGGERSLEVVHARPEFRKLRLHSRHAPGRPGQRGDRLAGGGCQGVPVERADRADDLAGDLCVLNLAGRGNRVSSIPIALIVLA